MNNYQCVRNECLKDMMQHGYSKEEALKILEKDNNAVGTVWIKKAIKETIETYFPNKQYATIDTEVEHIYAMVKIELRYRKDIQIDNCMNISSEDYTEAIGVLNKLIPESKNIVDYEEIVVRD